MDLSGWQLTGEQKEDTVLPRACSQFTTVGSRESNLTNPDRPSVTKSVSRLIMLHNRQTLIENHERFVARAVESETVWGINIGTGFASCNSQESPSLDVIMFWSDRAYAARSQKSEFPDAEVDSIKLFDFLFRWLPGMQNDGVMAGTNWTADLAGLEIAPDQLQQQLFDSLPVETLSRFKQIADNLRSSDSN